ncbi:LysE/ArgO family amino acid transporter [Nocardioides bigeumensis]|uniref:LysE/ArgO family amino acid transporter n=1 Tax=Nocardioides bigeumensis TaxID=433657 RepID=A0ABP5KNA4_9ACTN
MTSSFVPGLLVGLSLIVAIGAQNAFVLRQGLRREHVGTVVAICALSDLVLILAGVAGIGTIVERAPAALEVVRWLGVAFLTTYGVLSLWRARSADALHAASAEPASRYSVALRAVALTWLNPHVYLDTVLLLGGVAATHGDGRWWFAAGASAGSLLWFAGLGYGARRLHRVLSSPRAWQVLEVLIGLTMLLIALNLATGSMPE